MLYERLWRPLLLAALNTDPSEGSATLAATGQSEYSVEYVGRLALAKGYGESRIYRLDRR